LDVIAAAMKQHSKGSGRRGREIQWRGCSLAGRLALRSDALKAELGRRLVVDQVLECFARCPNDRPVQQQAIWAIHYCCSHSATKARLLGKQTASLEGEAPQKRPLVRLLAVLLVSKPQELRLLEQKATAAAKALAAQEAGRLNKPKTPKARAPSAAAVTASTFSKQIKPPLPFLCELGSRVLPVCHTHELRWR